MPGETTGVDTDTVYDLLASDRRRRVLRRLEEGDEPLDLDDLAEAVAAAETDGDPSVDRVTAVRTSLYHAHLPKLEDAGVVQFSTNPGRISLEEDADAVLALLEGPGDLR